VVSTPEVLHVGEPHEVFPHQWSVFGWLDGTDAWSARAELGDDLDGLARDLGEAVLAIRDLAGVVPAPARAPGERGGPIEPLVRCLERWLDDPQWRAADLIEIAAVRRLAAEALEVEDSAETTFVHGDLIAGNLLVQSGRLSAILDWGGAGYGDPAQDLAPAWSVLNAAARRRFREIIGDDDAAWVRARTIEVEHAVGGVLYYVPRQHPLGDVMTATLDRILADR
jgi:aminoglycoside phosphotransferase (APT) family kinase protein